MCDCGGVIECIDLKWRRKTMKFKDFEIRPTRFFDGHTDPKKWEVVKWGHCGPMEVIDIETGKKKNFRYILLCNCFS